MHNTPGVKQGKSLVLVAAGLALAAGCATTTTQSFVVVDSPNIETAHIAVGADFGKYDRLYASEMGIFFPSNAAPSLEVLQRTRQIFREAFLAELNEYQIVREKGPTALDVQATLVDYRNASADYSPKVRRELDQMARPGVLMFMMELKDSESGEVLARAADSSSAPAFSTSADTTTDWTAVEAAAARWASLFRNFLDNNLGK